jgi:hypothetical protein
MPQLDRLVFGGEVLFLVIVFLGLYLILVKNGLPILYKILVLRKEKLNYLRSSIIILTKENFLLTTINEQYLSLKLGQLLGYVQEIFNVVYKVDIKDTSLFFDMVVEDSLEHFSRDSVLVISYKNSILNLDEGIINKAKFIEKCY